MKRYFVKSLFTGWHEVPKENFDRFCEHIRKDAVNIPTDEREAYIATRTKIQAD